MIAIIKNDDVMIDFEDKTEDYKEFVEMVKLKASTGIDPRGEVAEYYSSIIQRQGGIRIFKSDKEDYSNSYFLKLEVLNKFYMNYQVDQAFGRVDDMTFDTFILLMVGNPEFIKAVIKY